MKSIKQYTEYSIKSILALCRIPSPSGFTKEAADFIYKELISLGHTPKRTRKNAVICEIGGKGRPLTSGAGSPY